MHGFAQNSVKIPPPLGWISLTRLPDVDNLHLFRRAYGRSADGRPRVWRNLCRCRAQAGRVENQGMGEKMLRKFVIAAGAAIGFLSVAPTASAALLTLDDVTLPGDPIQIVNGVGD